MKENFLKEIESGKTVINFNDEDEIKDFNEAVGEVKGKYPFAPNWIISSNDLTAVREDVVANLCNQIASNWDYVYQSSRGFYNENERENKSFCVALDPNSFLCEDDLEKGDIIDEIGGILDEIGVEHKVVDIYKVCFPLAENYGDPYNAFVTNIPTDIITQYVYEKNINLENWSNEFGWPF